MPEERRTRAGRPVWSGSISFGLVSIPVDLHAATRRAGVSLRMLDAEGRPLVREYVCPEHERALDDDEIERGFEVSEGEFVIVTDEELEELAPRRSRDIALDRFVPRSDVDPALFVRPYLVVPAGEQAKAYRLLAETMESSGRAALASFVLRGRSHAVAIFADRGLLRAETLRFGDELRTPADVDLPEAVGVDPEEVAAMARRVESQAAPDVDEHELRDREAADLRDLARRKRERGDDVVEVPEEAAGEDADGGFADVVDLVAHLRERLQGRRASRPGPRRAGESGTSKALDGASKQELYERARRLDVPGRSKMSREELLEALRRDRRA